MKYITNNDIVLKLNIDRKHIINYDKVKTITFQFFTNNKDNAVTKNIFDVNMFNYITLYWNELMLMEEGELKYTYSIYLLDGTVYDNTVITEYYICSNITNSVDNNKVILSNFYTKEEVNKLIDGVSAGDIDLTNYYTKSEVDNKIPSTDKFITSIPSEYITENELDSKGYLTQHQSLSNYYTKSEVNTLIDNVSSGDIDLTNYYTKNEVDNKIPTDYLKEIPSEYITESELNSKGYITEQYDDTSITNRVTTLETTVGNIGTIIDSINGEVI